MAKFAPLNGAFMATSMLGILVSVMYVYPQSVDFGIASIIVFGIMFVSSIISMSRSTSTTSWESYLIHRSSERR